MKIQTSTLPNGMTLFASVPHSARPHDSLLLERTHFLEDLLAAQNGKPWKEERGVVLKAHGDPAYLVHHVALSTGGMGNMRITEEWNYAELKGRFTFLKCQHMLKIKLMPVPLLLITALILRNAYTCLNGSEISAFYNCQPPSLEDWTKNGPML
jgi:hypothetical protein